MDIFTKHGTTPLHFAASSGQLEVCEWLKENGADLNFSAGMVGEGEDTKGRTHLTKKKNKSLNILLFIWLLSRDV